jgi:hypothetical protein
MSSAGIAPEVTPAEVTPKATAAQYLAAMLGAIAQYELNASFCRTTAKLAQIEDRHQAATELYATANTLDLQVVALRDAIAFAEGTS